MDIYKYIWPIDIDICYHRCTSHIYIYIYIYIYIGDVLDESNNSDSILAICWKNRASNVADVPAISVNREILMITFNTTIVLIRGGLSK